MLVRVVQSEGPRGAIRGAGNGTRRAPKERSISLPLLTDLLAVSEIAIAILMAVAAKYAYLEGYLRAHAAFEEYLGLGLVLSLILHVVLRRLDLYGPAYLIGRKIKAGRFWAGVTIAFLLLLALLYLFKVSDYYSRGWILVWYGMTVVTLLAGRAFWRTYARLLVAERRVSERVAVYGHGLLADEIIEHLQTTQKGIKVVGVFHDEASAKAPIIELVGGRSPDAADKSVAQRSNGSGFWRGGQIPAGGGLDQLIEAQRQGEIDKIVVALSPEHERLREVVSKLAVLPVAILYCPEVKRLPINVEGLGTLGDLYLLLVQKCPLSDRSRIVKTMLDVTVASIGLLLLSPLMVLIAIAIKLDSRGPVFFRQSRDGYNGKVIRVLKFRTMTVTEDGPTITQAQENDPRITRVGRVLRRLSLDELPQLFTVLSGGMSLVGPRPHAVAHGAQYSRLLEQYNMRHRMKPGLTGWAQVNGYRGPTEEPELMRRRVEHDAYYIDNWSIWFDIEIMLRTMLIVLRGRNAY